MTTGSRAASPVFVIGSPRSGTTLLYHQLLSAGDFAVYRAEANVFNLLAPRFGDLSVARRRSALLDAWLPSELFRRSELDPTIFRALVEQHCRNAGDVLRLLMEGVAARQHVRRWAECTPENLLYVQAIRRTIPEAIFLHVVRDGRDVACSIAEQGWIGAHLPHDDPARILLAGLYWEWMVRRGLRQLRQDTRDWREVRFEALVAQPATTLEAVGAFIHHDLDYPRIQQQAIGTVSRPNTSFPAEDSTAAFQPVGRWRGRLTEEALVRLEAAIGGLLQELGYPLHTDAAARHRTRRHVEATRRLAFGYFGSKHWLKTRTPLGQMLTSPALLRDFHAFDRDRLTAEAHRTSQV